MFAPGSNLKSNGFLSPTGNSLIRLPFQIISQTRFIIDSLPVKINDRILVFVVPFGVDVDAPALLYVTCVVVLVLPVDELLP